MEQVPKDSSNTRRRKFLKTLPFLGGAVAGVGAAPFEVAKSEFEGNKKREGNSVTVTLENGKKVSLSFGTHTDEFSEGQIFPESDIVGMELAGDFEKFFRLPASRMNITNNAPALREMVAGKILYHCDLIDNDNLSLDKALTALGQLDNTSYEYIFLDMLVAGGALTSLSKNKISRRNFIAGSLAGLSVGLNTRMVVKFGANMAIKKPGDITPGRQLLEKIKQSDDHNELAALLGHFSEKEKWELLQVINLARSVIIALKLKSALRVSNKESITVTVGLAHIPVEDFVTMKDEDLVKKLIPFKEGIKKYFKIESIYKMTSASFDNKGKEGNKLHMEHRDDSLLKDLVEKYL